MTKIYIRSIALFAMAFFGFMAASAQTTSVSNCSSSPNCAGQVSKQDCSQTEQVIIKKDQPVLHQLRVPPVTGQVAVNKSNIADVKSVAKSGEQVKQPVRIEQLQIARKQAADKGFPTTEYDAAIKEIITNQAQ